MEFKRNYTKLKRSLQKERKDAGRLCVTIPWQHVQKREAPKYPRKQYSRVKGQEFTEMESWKDKK